MLLGCVLALVFLVAADEVVMISNEFRQEVSQEMRELSRDVKKQLAEVKASHGPFKNFINTAASTPQKGNTDLEKGASDTKGRG